MAGAQGEGWPAESNLCSGYQGIIAKGMGRYICWTKEWNPKFCCRMSS